jgi:hypothetical protein
MPTAHLRAKALWLTTVLLPYHFNRARESRKARVADALSREWITGTVSRTELAVFTEARTHFAGTISSMVLLAAFANASLIVAGAVATAILRTNLGGAIWSSSTLVTFALPCYRATGSRTSAHVGACLVSAVLLLKSLKAFADAT